MKRMGVIAFCFLILLTSVWIHPFFVANALADSLSDSDRARDISIFDSIDSCYPKSEYQIRRRKNQDLSTDDGGHCNISAITTLLNRRLAADYRSGSFSVTNVLKSLGYSTVKTDGKLYSGINFETNGTKWCQYYYFSGSGTSANWCVSGKQYNNGSYSYKVTKISDSTIKSKTTKEGFNAYIASLLHDHPEGIAIRNKTANHVAVIYRYSYSNGAYTLYVKDPMYNYSGALSGSYISSHCGGDLYSNIDFIVYINGTCSMADGLEYGEDVVSIDEKAFPNSSFRDIVKQYDTNNNGILSSYEIAAVTEMDIESKLISNLKGIEYFTELSYLNCSQNNLVDLDLSKNTKLTTLNCYYNNLTHLDLSKLKNLIDLSCDGNKITNLDLSKNTSIQYLGFGHGSVETVNLSGCSNLLQLSCEYNNLSVLDLKDCAELKFLDCRGNNLSELWLGNNVKLGEINCSENNLSELWLGNNQELEELNCQDNNLTSLNLETNTNLTFLECYNNSITTLDISNCSGLRKFVQNNIRESYPDEGGGEGWDGYVWEDRVYYVLVVDPSVIVIAGDHISFPIMSDIDDADLVLPLNLTEIKEGAFEGLKIKSVRLGNKVKRIGSCAFADNKSLLQIYIPPCCEFIADDAFINVNPYLTIYGTKNSYAYDYALANGFNFEEY